MALAGPRALLILIFSCTDLVLARCATDSELFELPLNADIDPENDWFSSESEADDDLFDDDEPTDPVDSPNYLVYCREDGMDIVLPQNSISPMKIYGMNSFGGVPENCGYSLTTKGGSNVLQISYDCCEDADEDGSCTLRTVYRNSAGETEIATASCQVNSDEDAYPFDFPPLRREEFLSPPDFDEDTPDPWSDSEEEPFLHAYVPLRQPSRSPWSKKHGCLKRGNFVFTIPADIVDPPLRPSHLLVAGQRDCTPVMADKDSATFKFPVSECGARSYQIGDTMVYLAEVLAPIRTINMKYGVITRDHPVRVMVECRYSKSNSDTAGWASTGYTVMSANLPALVRAKGMVGVQLRIATDDTFTEFVPRNHQPLNVLLGNPVYLELRLNSPNPDATLLVHYCVAYPRSARSALVLLYEGCPNPFDEDNISILYTGDLPQNRNRRRFEVKAFQFMDQSTDQYLDEEIYFMCSTEICLPSDTPCRETCFDEQSP